MARFRSSGQATPITPLNGLFLITFLINVEPGTMYMSIPFLSLTVLIIPMEHFPQLTHSSPDSPSFAGQLGALRQWGKTIITSFAFNVRNLSLLILFIRSILISSINNSFNWNHLSIFLMTGYVKLRAKSNNPGKISFLFLMRYTPRIRVMAMRLE